MNDSAAVAVLPTATLPAVSADTQAFELQLRKAKVFAASTLVPQQYRNNLPDCVIAMNMAQRIGADVLQVMQNLYIVQGKPGWSGQFLIATFNQSGRFSAMRFEWTGQPHSKDWGCRAYATEKATGETIRGAWVTWKMAESEGWTKKNGSKWLTMPEMMFQYRAAAFLVRAYAPEIAMGLQTAEEIGDVTPTAVAADAAPTKADAIANALRSRNAEAPAHVDPDTGEIAPPAVTYAEIASRINGASSNDECDAVADLIRSIGDDTQRNELSSELAIRRAAVVGA